jgi:hypothetical protein
MRLPISQQPNEREFSIHTLQRVSSREQRGDLAFDLSIKDEQGQVIYAYAPKPYPAFFPRVLFEK